MIKMSKYLCLSCPQSSEADEYLVGFLEIGHKMILFAEQIL